MTSFLFVLAMIVVFAGLTTLLKTQLEQSLAVKSISLARVQAYYLAEMGLNDVMYNANFGTPLPTFVFPSNGTVKDFTANVSMTRGKGSNLATCTYLQLVGIGQNYQVLATLQVPPDPTVYTRAINFSATWSAPVWVLTAFTLVK